MARCAWCGAENPSDGRFCLKCGKPIGGGAIPGKCTHCGQINALDARRCENCGAPVSGSAQGMSSDGECKWCGKPALLGLDVCRECDNRQYDTSLASLDKEHSDTLTAAAVLLVIAGAITVFQGVYLLALESMIVAADLPSPVSLGCCGLIDILFGVGAIAGGYFAYRRSNFLLAVAGCLVALFGLGLVFGSVLGLIALILVLMRKDDF